jgi:FixJ family two-component response regulator
MNPKNLNLYIVDDDEAVRRSLGSLLLARLPDCSVKTFASGEAFLEGANLDGSGVVLLDLRMEPGISGLEVFAALQERTSPLVVVFLSGHGTLPVAVRAMQEGAVTWLEKPCKDEHLMEAVEQAKARAAGIAAARRDRHQALQRWAKVTPREKQVAPLVAQGMSSKVAAQLLTQQAPAKPINWRTVDNYRASIFDKLEIANSNELLVFLRDNGL